MNKKYPSILTLIIFLNLFFPLVNMSKIIEKPAYKKIPEFVLWGAHNKMFSSKELEGKVVLINFWGSWLLTKSKNYKKTGKPRENAEIIRLNELYKNYKNKNDKVEIVSICVDNMPTSKFKRFIKKVLMVDFYLLLSDGGEIEKKFENVPVIPTTYIIDKKGYIRNEFKGENDIKIYKEIIDKLLIEK
ncbi:TlpA family protein disulfide reductase [Candidatus Poribacteria bacterium]|nr:TlpA family protein disulfide reductase [Candidatus Poribacteria bacterium]